MSEETIELNTFEDQHAIAKEIYLKKKELNLDEVTIDILKFEKDETKINIKGTVNTDKKTKVEEFNEFITKLNNANICNLVKLQDSRFIKVSNLINLITGEKVDYAHSQGEVVLIDVWATWCGPCQKPMSHNQEMLERNEENWNGKVRILGLSVDEEIESIKQRVEEKKWNKIEHYQVEGGWSHEIMETYEINGIPQVFLLDKKGDIQYSGHPNSIDLEKAINDLIEDKPFSLNQDNNKKQELNIPSSIPYDEYKKINEQIESFKIKNKELISSLKEFNIYNRINKSFNENNFENMNVIPSTNIVVVDQNENKERILKIKKELEDLTNDLQNKINLKTKLYYEKSITITDLGLLCSKCNKTLTVENPRFVCVVCQLEGKVNHTFCKECVPDADEEDYINTPFHEHHLYYVPSNSEEVLKSAKNIKNSCSKYEEPSENKKVGGYGCDNCGNGVYVCDWSCAVCTENVCGSYDLCNKCFKISQDVNHSEYSNLKLAEGEHDPKTHAMARIPYTLYASRSEYEEV